MADVVAQVEDLIETPLRTNEFRRFLRVFLSRKVVIFGAVIILALIITAIFAPFIAPYDPYKQNLSEALQGPSKAHLLGTDPLGRDELSRIIYGTRISLLVGIVAVGFAAIVGMMLGLVAGYFGGFINTIIMRFIDALMAIPPIMLALAIAAALGGGLWNVIISLGISLIPTQARLMRGQVLTVKQADYVTAGEVIGAGNTRIMMVLPTSKAFLPRLTTCHPQRATRHHHFFMRPSSFMIASYSTIFFFTSAREASGPRYSVLKPF